MVTNTKKDEALEIFRQAGDGGLNASEAGILLSLDINSSTSMLHAMMASGLLRRELRQEKDAKGVLRSLYRYFFLADEPRKKPSKGRARKAPSRGISILVEASGSSYALSYDEGFELYQTLKKIYGGAR